MVTVRRLNTEELLDMLWEELPEAHEAGERNTDAPAAEPFEIPTEPAPGQPAFPEPFSRQRRRGP